MPVTRGVISQDVWWTWYFNHFCMILCCYSPLLIPCCYCRCQSWRYAAARDAGTTPLLSLPPQIKGCYLYRCCWCYAPASYCCQHWWCYAATAYATSNAMLLLLLSLPCCYNWWHFWCYAATDNATADGMLLKPMPWIMLCSYCRWHCWRYAVTGDPSAGAMLLLAMPLLVLCYYWHPWCYAADTADVIMVMLPLSTCSMPLKPAYSSRFTNFFKHSDLTRHDDTAFCKQCNYIWSSQKV